MSEAKADATYRVGVDIGGTFTDLILVETATGAMTVGKSLTTPTDPSEAVETVLRDALLRSGVEAAQVERDHSRDHPGHEQPDRAQRLQDGAADDQRASATPSRSAASTATTCTTSSWRCRSRWCRATSAWRLTSACWRAARSSRPPDLEDLEPLVRELKEKGIEAIAVCLLHSYANPTHERQVADLIAKTAPEIRVSISSDVVPEIREYERTSTTCANVYVQARVDRTCTILRIALADARVRAATCS